MNKNLIKNITFAIGGLLIAAAVLLFALVGDLSFRIGSMYMLILILPGLASAVCFFAASRYRDEPKKMLILKLIAIGMAVVFIVLLFYLFYLTTLAPAEKAYDPNSSVKKALDLFKLKYATSTYKASNTGIFSAFLAASALGLIGQVSNVVLCAVWKDE